MAPLTTVSLSCDDDWLVQANVNSALIDLDIRLIGINMLLFYKHFTEQETI